MNRIHTEPVIRQTLAINVRALRIVAGLTVRAAAERAEMHWRMWQKIEAAQVSAGLGTLGRLADVLGVKPMELLRETQRPAAQILYS